MAANGVTPSVDHTFNSLLLTSKILAVFPFDHVRARLSPSWTLYSSVVFTIISVEVAFIVIDPPDMAKFSIIHNHLYRCQMLAFCVCMCIFNLFVVVKRARLEELFRGLNYLGGYPLEKTRFKTVIVYCSIQGFMIAFTSTMDFLVNQPFKNMILFSLSYYYAMITIITAGNLPFVTILELIFSRFEAVTSKMKSLQYLNNCQHYVNDLLKYVILYNKSTNLLATLNDIFTFQLLFISFVSFINVTTNIYYIVDYLVSSSVHQLDVKDTAKFMPVFTGWIIIFASLICFPIHSCQRLVYQAKEFNTLLYQLMIDDKTNDLANNKKLRLHISMKREVVFTACGFFTLDYTLVHSMIAAATTYLVILIQFGQPNCIEQGRQSGNYTTMSTTEYPHQIKGNS